MKILGREFTVFLGDVADALPIFKRRASLKAAGAGPSVFLLSWSRRVPPASA